MWLNSNYCEMFIIVVERNIDANLSRNWSKANQQHNRCKLLNTINFPIGLPLATAIFIITRFLIKYFKSVKSFNRWINRITKRTIAKDSCPNSYYFFINNDKSYTNNDNLHNEQTGATQTIGKVTNSFS